MLNSVTFHLGMDVHKDSTTIAVSRHATREPEVVERLPYDLKKLKRLLQHRIHSRRPPRIEAVAVARELIRFIWAAAQDDVLHAA